MGTIHAGRTGFPGGRGICIIAAPTSARHPSAARTAPGASAQHKDEPMNKLKARLKSGKACVNAWLAIPSGFSAEVMAQCGFDLSLIHI